MFGSYWPVPWPANQSLWRRYKTAKVAPVVTAEAMMRSMMADQLSFTAPPVRLAQAAAPAGAPSSPTPHPLPLGWVRLPHPRQQVLIVTRQMSPSRPEPPTIEGRL